MKRAQALGFEQGGISLWQQMILILPNITSEKKKNMDVFFFEGGEKSK